MTLSSRKTASDSSPSLRPRLPNGDIQSTRWASRITVELMQKVRKSVGKMVCGLFTSSLNTPFLNEYQQNPGIVRFRDPLPAKTHNLRSQGSDMNLGSLRYRLSLRKPIPVKNLSKRLARIAPDYFAGKIKNPFFIIGCNRSGKSLLASTLAYHRRIAVYPEEGLELWHPQTFPWLHSSHRDYLPPYVF